MRERSRLLREGRTDPAWLAALEELMATEGVAVAAARRDAIERLDRVCADARRAPFRAPGSALSARSKTGSAEMPALAAEDRFARRWPRPGRATRLSGGAAVGPHRSDLAVTHAEKNIAAEAASTGEQKALLIAIVLAQARVAARDPRRARRCCCSTRWRRISTRRAAPRCSRSSPGSTARPGSPAPMPRLFAPLRGAARFLSVHDGALSETEF